MSDETILQEGRRVIAAESAALQDGHRKDWMDAFVQP